MAIRVFLICLLLITSTVCAGGVGWAADPIDFSKPMARMNVGVIGGGPPAAAGGPCTAAGIIACQGFEGTGYDNSETWSESGTGTINEDYTTTALADSQSLFLSASAQAPKTAFTFASTQTEIWGYFLFRPTTLMDTSKEMVVIFDSGTGMLYQVDFYTTGKFLCRIAGSGSVATTDALSVDTTYHVWFHFKNGSGDAVCSVGFSTDGTEPTSGNAYTSKTNGTNTTAMVKMQFGWTGNAAGAYIIDKVRISTSASLGNSPK